MTLAVPVMVAAIAVRNPFWPIGYEGVREVISAEPTVEVSPAHGDADDSTATAAAVAAAADARIKGETGITARQWQEARNSLRIIGTTVVTDVMTGKKRKSVIINGGTYADGEYVSANHEGNRFTWRVTGITGGKTLKLKRVRAKPLDDGGTEEGKGTEK
jgi:hypothetical protein